MLEGAFVYRAWSVEQAMSDADDAESATPAGSHIRERLLRQSQTQSGHEFLGFLLTISSPAELIVNPCKAKHARFDSADAGAADCIPKQAGEIRKGSYAMLKGHPCKVVDYSTSALFA